MITYDINKRLILSSLEEAISTPIALGIGTLGAAGAYNLNKADHPIKPKQPTIQNEELPQEVVKNIDNASPIKLDTPKDPNYDPTKDPKNVQYEGPSQDFLDHQNAREIAHNQMNNVAKEKWGLHLKNNPEVDPTDGAAWIKFRSSLTDTIQDENSRAIDVDINSLHGFV